MWTIRCGGSGPVVVVERSGPTAFADIPPPAESACASGPQNVPRRALPHRNETATATGGRPYPLPYQETSIGSVTVEGWGEARPTNFSCSQSKTSASA